jgi:hypothetical protein
MTSKYEASVQHAMGSWHKALQQEQQQGKGTVGRPSLAVQRRDLMNSVISEQRQEEEGNILSSVNSH